MSEKTLLDHHNDGQKDGADGNYNPPVPVDPITRFTWPSEAIEEFDKQNAAYDAGYKNGSGK